MLFLVSVFGIYYLGFGIRYLVFWFGVLGDCGIGMVWCAPRTHVEAICDVLTSQGEEAFVIGTVETAQAKSKIQIDSLEDAD